MNCCDYNCHQGRDCPARVAKIGQRLPGAELLPPNPWRTRLRVMAGWMLIVLAVVLVSCMWIGLIAASAVVAPNKRLIDCGMASFHPDFTPAMREACRKRFKT